MSFSCWQGLWSLNRFDAVNFSVAIADISPRFVCLGDFIPLLGQIIHIPLLYHLQQQSLPISHLFSLPGLKPFNHSHEPWYLVFYRTYLGSSYPFFSINSFWYRSAVFCWFFFLVRSHLIPSISSSIRHLNYFKEYWLFFPCCDWKSKAEEALETKLQISENLGKL